MFIHEKFKYQEHLVGKFSAKGNFNKAINRIWPSKRPPPRSNKSDQSLGVGAYSVKYGNTLNKSLNSATDKSFSSTCWYKRIKHTGVGKKTKT